MIRSPATILICTLLSDHPSSSAGDGSFSQLKWNTLGSPETFQQINNYMQSKATNEKLKREPHAPPCKSPTPVNVPVGKVYPQYRRAYFPHCVTLHLCGDLFGCCRRDDYVCAPLEEKIVVLRIIVSEVIRQEKHDQLKEFEFKNHTQCHCVPISQNPSAKVWQGALGFNWTLLAGNSYETKQNLEWQQDAPEISRMLAEPSSSQCTCPSKFATRTFANGTCSCDCFDGHKECLREKKGLYPLSAEDVECINSAECTEPTCEFGKYMDTDGKCPSRPSRRSSESRRFSSHSWRFNGY